MSHLRSAWLTRGCLVLTVAVTGALLGTPAAVAQDPPPPRAYDLERVSVAGDGSEAEGASDESAISAEGRMVAFSGVLSYDGTAVPQVYVRDRAAGTTGLVSLDPAGLPLDTGAGAYSPSISGDGRLVAFTADGVAYVRDRQAGATTTVPGQGGDQVFLPRLSTDGSDIVYQRVDDDGASTLVLADVAAATSRTIAAIPSGRSLSSVSVSGDGSVLAFATGSSGAFRGAGATDLLRVENDARCNGVLRRLHELQLAQPWWIYDPSGIVYEGVRSNRLPGVTATLSQQGPDGAFAVWGAGPYGPVNPLLTGEDGAYAWNVPRGQWQLAWTRAGYESGHSPVLTVLPEHTDVDHGMVFLGPPNVTTVTALTGDGASTVDLTFDRWVRVGVVEAGVVGVADVAVGAVDGSVSAVDAETSPAGESLARTFRFTADGALGVGDLLTLTVDRTAQSYAPRMMAADVVRDVTVDPRPVDLLLGTWFDLEADVTFVSAEVCLPYARSAGDPAEDALALFHRHDGGLVADVTTRHDRAADRLCASVSELSAFMAGATDTEPLAGTDRFATAAAIGAARFAPGVDVAFVATGEDFPDALAAGPAAAVAGAPILLVARDALPGVTAAELDRLAPRGIVVLGGTAAVAPEVELTSPSNLPAATAHALGRVDPQAITVLGGPAAVSRDVEVRLAGYLP